MTELEKRIAHDKRLQEEHNRKAKRTKIGAIITTWIALGASLAMVIVQGLH